LKGENDFQHRKTTHSFLISPLFDTPSLCQLACPGKCAETSFGSSRKQWPSDGARYLDCTLVPMEYKRTAPSKRYCKSFLFWK